MNPTPSSSKEHAHSLENARALYINLMKDILVNHIYEDVSFSDPYNPEYRHIGLDHPTVAHTMIGMKRLNNIQFCVEDVIKRNIPGDLIETGVWRGGATILMRALLKAYEETTRKVWVADSFEGLPPPNTEKYPSDKGHNLFKIDYLAVSLEEVRNNFRKYGLLDHQVVFLKGLFSATLPTAPIEKLSVLRLDGDLYESTMDALTTLYPKLSIGGYIIIDDYGAMPPCAEAVNDYRNQMEINDDTMEWIDQSGVFWEKTR